MLILCEKPIKIGVLLILLICIGCQKTPNQLLLGQWQNVRYHRILKSNTGLGYDTIDCSRPIFLKVEPKRFRFIEFDFQEDYIRQEALLEWDLKNSNLTLYDQDSRDDLKLIHLTADSLVYKHKGATYTFRKNKTRQNSILPEQIRTALQYQIFDWKVGARQADSSRHIEFFSDFYIFPNDPNYPLNAWRSDTVGEHTFLFLEGLSPCHYLQTIELENWDGKTWEAKTYNLGQKKIQSISLRLAEKMQNSQRDSIRQKLIGLWQIDAFTSWNKTSTGPNNSKTNKAYRSILKKLQFNEDGTLDLFKSSGEQSGTWRQSQQGNLILIQLGGKLNHQSLRIEKLSKDSLIARIPQANEWSVTHGIEGRVRLLKTSSLDKEYQKL